MEFVKGMGLGVRGSEEVKGRKRKREREREKKKEKKEESYFSLNRN